MSARRQPMEAEGNTKQRHGGTRRRGNRQGSVFQVTDAKHGTRWCAQFSLGRGLNGKRRYLRAFGATAEEAQQKLVKLQHRHQVERRPVPTERETVATYLMRWLAEVKPTLRPKTYRSYEQLCRLHLVPGLGHRPLQELSVRDVQWFLNAKSKSAKLRAVRPASKAADVTCAVPVSPRYVQFMHAVLRAALASAVRLEVLDRNVAALARSPRQRTPTFTPLTPEQARAFLDSLTRDRMRALFVTALATGCRLGEVLALRWRDVDLEAGRLTVRHTLQRVEKEWVLAEPKTTRSVRRLMLPTFAVEALKRHHREQAERRLALGPEWKNTLGLVFTTFDGNPLDPVNVTHALQRRLAKAKLPQQRFHDLRHATATFLLMQKVPVKLVAEQLGHSDVRLTQNTYQHVLDELKKDVADNLEAVLGAAVGAH